MAYAENLQRVLDEWSADGWELVSVTVQGVLEAGTIPQHLIREYTLFWKRDRPS